MANTLCTKTTKLAPNPFAVSMSLAWRRRRHLFCSFRAVDIIYMPRLSKEEAFLQHEIEMGRGPKPARPASATSGSETSLFEKPHSPPQSRPGSAPAGKQPSAEAPAGRFNTAGRGKSTSFGVIRHTRWASTEDVKAPAKQTRLSEELDASPTGSGSPSKKRSPEQERSPSKKGSTKNNKTPRTVRGAAPKAHGGRIPTSRRSTRRDRQKHEESARSAASAQITSKGSRSPSPSKASAAASPPSSPSSPSSKALATGVAVAPARHIGASLPRLQTLKQEFTPYRPYALDDPVFAKFPGLNGPVKGETPSFALIDPGRVLSPRAPPIERPVNKFIINGLGINWFPWAEALLAKEEEAVQAQSKLAEKSTAAGGEGWWPFGGKKKKATIEDRIQVCTACVLRKLSATPSATPPLLSYTPTLPPRP